MKISTKGRYGVRILLDLASHRDDGAPRLIRDIAASQQISEKYVSTLIVALRRAGMVESIRGMKGGYRLTRDPKRITLLEVVEVMEGPVCVVHCVDHPGRCRRHEGCSVRGVWNRLNEQIRAGMRKIALQQLVGSTDLPGKPCGG